MSVGKGNEAFFITMWKPPREWMFFFLPIELVSVLSLFMEAPCVVPFLLML